MKKTLMWGLFTLITLVLGGVGIWLFLKEQHQASRLLLADQVLTAVYDRTRIDSAEAVYNFLFPFDFLPWDPIAWKELEKQSDQRRPIPPNDYQTLELVRLARNLGFDPARQRFKFLVVGVKVKAGIDLEATPLEVGWNSLEPEPELEIFLPTPGITEFQVLDPPVDSRFPSTRFSPQEWSLLVTALKPKILTRLLQDGLLDQSRRSIEDNFHRVLGSAGYPNYKISWKTLTLSRQED